MDKKQKLLIEYILADRSVFAKSYRILKPSYFEPPFNVVVEVMLKYFGDHKKPPSVDVIEAETDVKLVERTLDQADISYTLEEIETHCRNKALEEAVLHSADLINEGSTSQIMEVMRQAMTVRLDRNIGMGLFDHAESRILDEEENGQTFSSGLESVDTIIGRMRQPDFGMVYAVSSGGKSLMLGNMSIALSEQELDVVIVTLELKEALYAKRLDAMITGYDINDQWKNANRIEEYYRNKCGGRGNITIKKMVAGSTANDIDAYLLDYSLEKGHYPDVLIVDYLGLMGVDNVRSTNKFDIDHEKSIGLIRMGEMYNMTVISAGQINRDGYDVVKVTAQHCAGGISVINNSDWAIALVANEEDIDNDQVQVQALKIRHTQRQTGSKVLYRNPRTLKFSDNPHTEKNNKISSNVVDRFKKTDENTQVAKGKGNKNKAIEQRSEPKKTSTSTKKRIQSVMDLVKKG